MDGNIYTVYFLGDELKIQYVGRVKSVNYSNRMQYHKRTRNLEPYFYVNNLTYKEAMGLEEIGMIVCHTLTHEFPNNTIHGISDFNPLKNLYMFDAFSYLDNLAEATLLNLLEGE